MPNELSEYIYERDRHEFSLGDTLDMKTGLLLAALTFLAIQSSSLISETIALTRTQFALQAFSIACIVMGGIFCAIELWPRNYLREATPLEYEAWINSLDEYRKQYPGVEVPVLQEARLSMARERVQANGAINERKSKFMFWAFYATLAAFIVNLATMTMRLF